VIRARSSAGESRPAPGIVRSITDFEIACFPCVLIHEWDSTCDTISFDERPSSANDRETGIPRRNTGSLMVSVVAGVEPTQPVHRDSSLESHRGHYN
jgi:hypothetical protein